MSEEEGYLYISPDVDDERTRSALRNATAMHQYIEDVRADLLNAGIREKFRFHKRLPSNVETIEKQGGKFIPLKTRSPLFLEGKEVVDC